jgi:hypothetical protein
LWLIRIIRFSHWEHVEALLFALVVPMIAIAIFARVWWWLPLAFALVIVAPLVVGRILIGGLLVIIIFAFIVILVVT